MQTLSPNLKEIFEFINYFLIFVTMTSLYARLRKFKDVPLAGSWFRWKAFFYTIIIFAIDMFSIYYAWKNQPIFAIIRLTCSRITILWEIEYCHNYRFNKLPDSVRYALQNPWILEFGSFTIEKYIPLTDRTYDLLNRIRKSLMGVRGELWKSAVKNFKQFKE